MVALVGVYEKTDLDVFDSHMSDVVLDDNTEERLNTNKVVFSVRGKKGIRSTVTLLLRLWFLHVVFTKPLS